MRGRLFFCIRTKDGENYTGKRRKDAMFSSRPIFFWLKQLKDSEQWVPDIFCLTHNQTPEMSIVPLYLCLLGSARLIKVIVKEQNMEVNHFWLAVAGLTYISNYQRPALTAAGMCY